MLEMGILHAVAIVDVAHAILGFVGSVEQRKFHSNGGIRLLGIFGDIVSGIST
jgi:hypothetical protein